MHGLCLGIERNDRQHRAEDFFALDRHTGGDIGEYGGADVKAPVEAIGAAKPTCNQPRAFINALLDEALNLVPLALVHDRADVLARFGCGANLDGRCDFGGDFNGTRVGRAFHQHAAWRVAGLARIVHHMAHAAFYRAVVGIGEDQVGTFATQFKRHTFQGLRGGHGYGAARTGRTCEGNHFNIRVRRQLAAHTGAIAVYKVEHTRRQARVMAKFGKQHGRQRRFFGWFQHTGAARKQRRDYLQRDLVHRPVPRRDQANHTDGFKCDAVIRRVGAKRADPIHLVKRSEKVLQMPRQAGGL